MGIHLLVLRGNYVSKENQKTTVMSNDINKKTVTSSFRYMSLVFLFPHEPVVCIKLGSECLLKVC